MNESVMPGYGNGEGVAIRIIDADAVTKARGQHLRKGDLELCLYTIDNSAFSLTCFLRRNCREMEDDGEAKAAPAPAPAPAPAAAAAGGSKAPDCAVCLEPIAGGLGSAARLPCCFNPESSTQYCTRCIEIICERSPGRVGRCPTCRTAHIRFNEATGDIELAERVHPCHMCRQARVIVDGGLCEACALGVSVVLSYECEGCGGIQRIPHPMWRYQAHPGEFGNTSWACHRGCGGYTKWRVAPEDVHRVPLHDTPAGWPDRRDDWLASIREQRLEERRTGARRAVAPRQGPGQGAGGRAALGRHDLMVLLGLFAALVYMYWQRG
eukprot:g4338.t1